MCARIEDEDGGGGGGWYVRAGRIEEVVVRNQVKEQIVRSRRLVNQGRQGGKLGAVRVCRSLMVTASSPRGA